jgi:hypothetical protein
MHPNIVVPGQCSLFNRGQVDIIGTVQAVLDVPPLEIYHQSDKQEE